MPPSEYWTRCHAIAGMTTRWPRDAAVHFDTATCGFSATACISCWSLSTDCNQIAHVRINVSRVLQLFGCEIIFEVFQPMWSRYLNVTEEQTDGRYTVASPRGKNRETKYRRYYRYCRYLKLKIPVYCRFKNRRGPSLHIRPLDPRAL